MFLQRLELRDLRNFSHSRFDLTAGANLFCGPNGSGKTTLLEAVWLLGTGRSFRATSVDDCLSLQAGEGRVSALLDDLPITYAKTRRQSPEIRVGAKRAKSSSSLARLLPLVLIDSGSLAILAGLPQQRRDFVNSGSFHLAAAFHLCWRSYREALRQRNAALKSQARQEALAPWEALLDQHGTAMVGHWRHWLQSFEAELHQLLKAADHPFLEQMRGRLQLRIAPGWPEGTSLREQLERRRERDSALGYTGLGPHRGDLSVELEERPAAGQLSAGERKLLTATMLLAQASLPCASDRGAAPLLLLDDLAAELDRDSLHTLLRLAERMPNQKLMTAINEESFLEAMPRKARERLVQENAVWRLGRAAERQPLQARQETEKPQ